MYTSSQLQKHFPGLYHYGDQTERLAKLLKNPNVLKITLNMDNDLCFFLSFPQEKNTVRCIIETGWKNGSRGLRIIGNYKDKDGKLSENYVLNSQFKNKDEITEFNKFLINTLEVLTNNYESPNNIFKKGDLRSILHKSNIIIDNETDILKTIGDNLFHDNNIYCRAITDKIGEEIEETLDLYENINFDPKKGNFTINWVTINWEYNSWVMQGYDKNGHKNHVNTWSRDATALINCLKLNDIIDPKIQCLEQIPFFRNKEYQSHSNNLENSSEIKAYFDYISPNDSTIALKTYRHQETGPRIILNCSEQNYEKFNQLNLSIGDEISLHLSPASIDKLNNLNSDQYIILGDEEYEWEFAPKLENLKRAIGPYLSENEDVFNNFDQETFWQNFQEEPLAQNRDCEYQRSFTLHHALISGADNCDYKTVHEFAADLFSGKLEKENKVEMNFNLNDYPDNLDTINAWHYGAYLGLNPRLARLADTPPFIVYEGTIHCDNDLSNMSIDILGPNNELKTLPCQLPDRDTQKRLIKAGLSNQTTVKFCHNQFFGNSNDSNPSILVILGPDMTGIHMNDTFIPNGETKVALKDLAKNKEYLSPTNLRM